MNIVFLSPHFPPNFRHFVRGLRDAGATVLGLGDEPFDNMPGELRSQFHEYYRVGNMEHYDDLLRGIGYLTHRWGKIDRLDSLNEYWLESEAKLRTDFNVFGVQTDWIDNIKRKSQMKQRFIGAGLEVARGRVCLNAEEARALIAEVGYPVVAKPDIGVGAAKTYKIHDDFEFEHYLRDKLPCDYIIEEFIGGDIVTFDGLTDKDGQILFSSSLRYSTGVMDVVNRDGDIYYYSEREIPPALEAAGRAAVNAFQVRERFFHLEFFNCGNDRIVALEANIRPPGGLTVDMFNFAFDFDVYREWANVLVAGQFSAPVTRKYAVGYVGRKHHLNYKLSHEQALECAGQMLCHHEGIMGVFAKAIGNYGYILRCPDEAALIATAEAMLEKR